MRTITYIGKPARIGRFGQLNTGEKLEVTEMEFASLQSQNHPHFDLNGGDVVHAPTAAQPNNAGAAGRPKKNEKPGPVKLKDHEAYKLTTLAWGDPRIMGFLHAKPKAELIKIAIAMKSLGCLLKPLPSHTGAELCDMIIGAAKNAGWIKEVKVESIPEANAPLELESGEKEALAKPDHPRPTIPTEKEVVDAGFPKEDAAALIEHEAARQKFWDETHKQPPAQNGAAGGGAPQQQPQNATA